MKIKRLGMKTKSFYKITAPLLCIVLTLSACSGGGGGGGGSEPDSESFATISGTAAKGIIRNALVTAFELDIAGKELRTIGTANTDEKEGTYQLPIGEDYAGGPVLLKLSARDDGSTMMVCDISDGCNGVKFGETLPLGEDFEIESILPEVEKESEAKAHITPFTHMAARRVLAGAVNPEAIKNAFSEVSQMVGVDILETAPLDITKGIEGSEGSDEQRVYSAFLAAAGKLAVADPGGLEAGLKKLADTFQDGKFDAEDDFSIRNLIDAAKVEAAYSKIETPRLEQIISIIEAQTDEDGNYDPEPSNTATTSPVKKAKALIEDIRTWVNSVTELSDPAEAFDADVEKAAKVLNSNSAALAEMTINVITSIFEEFQSIVTADDNKLELGEYIIGVTDRQDESVGNAKVTLSDDNGIKMMIPEQTLEGITFNLELATNIPKKALDDESFDLDKAQISASGAIANSRVSMTLNGVDLKVDFESPATIAPYPTKPSHPEVKYASLSGNTTLKTSDVTFDGSASMKFTKLTQAAVNSNSTVSLEEVSVDGKFMTSDGSSFSAKAKLAINNAATFDTFAFLKHEPVMWIEGSKNGDYSLEDESMIHDINPALVSLYYAYFHSGQTCYGGSPDYDGPTNPESGRIDNCLQGDILDVQKYITDIVKQQYPSAGHISNISASVELDGYTHYSAQVDFPDFETAEKFAKATLSVTLDLTLKGYPNSKVIISADRDEIEGGDLSMTLIRDGRITTYSVSVNANNPIPETLKVTNFDNVMLVLTKKDDQLNGKLSVDGVSVGTIENTDNGLFLVRYQDGTFETLQ